MISFALLAIVAAAISIALSSWTHAKPKCTHGVSSIGPVTITNGSVAGDTTPHTEKCLP
jgi:hypothetical protein